MEEVNQAEDSRMSRKYKHSTKEYSARLEESRLVMVLEIDK